MTVEDAPRTRRSFFAAAVGTVVGLAAGTLGRPVPASAANGSPTLLGRTNSASATTTVSTSSGTAVSGKSSSSTGRGVTGNATRTSGTTIGAYGIAASPSGDAVRGASTATATGTGAAVRAIGNRNDGVVATTTAQGRAAIRATASGGGRAASLRATTSDGTPVLVVADGTYPDAEFQAPFTPGAVLVGTDDIAGLSIHARNPENQGCQAIFAKADGGVTAIWGMNSSGSGDVAGATGGCGVSGDTDSPDGFGVWGTNGWRDPAGAGVAGFGPTGVRGQSTFCEGQRGKGVEGIAGIPGAYAGWFDGELFTTAYLGVSGISDPPSPPGEQVRLYARPQAASPAKLEVCARFPDGSIVVLAKQP